MCSHCSNSFHYSCTNFSKKECLNLKKGNKKYKCHICISKSKKCDKCYCKIHPSLKGVYCVECLEYSCKKCLKLTRGKIQELLSTIDPYYCNDCHSKLYCSVCTKLCEDEIDSEASILCDCCKQWVHFGCSKLDTRQFNKLGKSRDPYFCMNCIKDNLPFTKLPNYDIFENQVGRSFDQCSLSDNNCKLCTECNIECDICSSCPDMHRVCDECLNCELLSLDSYIKFMNDQKDNELSFLHFNIISLSANLQKIKELLYCLEKLPDIICISETKLNENSNKNDVQLQGYRFYENNSTSKFGGTAVYISENFRKITSRRKDLEINIPGECEATFVELKFTSNKKKSKVEKNVIVGSIYRHPHTNHNEFFSELSDKLSKIKKNCPIFLLGDININLLDLDCNWAKQYKNLLLSYGLRNFIVKQPTRITSNTETVIDHFITNLNNNDMKTGVLVYDASDHLPTCGIAKMAIPKNTFEPKIFVRKFDETKETLFCNTLQENIQSISELSDNFDPNDAMEKLLKTIQNTYDSTFPLTKRSKRARKHFRKPWISSSILNLIKIKHRMYKKYKDTKNNLDLEAYKRQRNIVKRKIEHAKREYYYLLFRKSKNNIKKTWRNVKTVLNKKCGKGNSIPTLIKSEQNTLYSDPIDVVDRLNEHFVAKGPRLASKIRPSSISYKKYLKLRNNHTMVFSKILQQEVIKIVSELENDKASGHDGISAKILKWCLPYISVILTNIFNRCVQVGLYPDTLKIARVTALHKGGDPCDVDNYRPISILPQINKVFEKLIHRRLISFLNKYKIISKQQFGFQKLHSTSHSIACLHEKLIKNIEDKKDSAVLFIDLKAAFDTIDTEILLKKLDHYGIRNNTLKLLSSYLHNRKQFIKSDSFESALLSVLCGVPQGSVLGPLLFILFMNDL